MNCWEAKAGGGSYHIHCVSRECVDKIYYDIFQGYQTYKVINK